MKGPRCRARRGGRNDPGGRKPSMDACPFRKPIGWRLTENRAMLICNERSCQAHCLGGCRSVSVAGSDRGRDFNVAAADHCSATNRPQKTILRCHRPNGVRWSLSPLSSRSWCACDCWARDRNQMAPCGLPFVLALEVAASWWPANSSAGNTQTDPRDEHRQPTVGSATDPWRAAQARHRDRTDECG
jgi:hypothetical protein